MTVRDSGQVEPPYALLERDRELASFAEALRGSSRSGNGQAVLIEGPAGIGKTTLLSALREQAQSNDYRVLGARASTLEREFGFGVVRQLLGPRLRRADAAQRARLLSGPARLAAGVLGLEDPASIEAEPAEASLYGLFWLCAALAEEGPLLLAVDDLHWSDGASLRFLQYLARRLSGMPIVLALASRPFQPGAAEELPQLLQEHLHSLAIRPALLSEEATATVVRSRLGEDLAEDVVLACRHVSGGNPLLIDELLRELEAHKQVEGPISAELVAAMAPARIAESVIARAHVLGAEAPAVLRALAVLGERADLRSIAELAEVETARLAAILDGLQAAAVLAVGEQRRFAHPLLASAVYEQIPAASRAGLHARAADLLQSRGAPAESVAAHLLRCEPHSVRGASATLELAASRAMESGAPDSAAAYLRRALTEAVEPGGRGPLLHRLAHAEVVLRDPVSVSHLQEAAELTQEPSLAFEILLELTDVLALAGQWEAAATTIDLALERFGASGLPGVLDLEAVRAAYRGYDPSLAHLFREDRPRLFELVAGRRDAESDHLRWVLAGLGTVGQMPREEVLELIGPSERDWSRLRSGRESSLISQAMLGLLMVDEPDAGDRIAQALRDAGREGGSLFAMIAGVGFASALDARCGRLGSSEANLLVAFELLKDNELSLMMLATFVHFSLEAIVERSGLGELAQVVESLQMPPDFGATMSGAFVLEVRAALRAVNGQREQALADLREVERIHRGVGSGPRISCWRSRLALALPEQDRSLAIELAREELELARQVVAPRAQGMSLRTLGLLAGGEEGLAALNQSVRVLRDCQAALELARSLAELGSALGRANRRSNARLCLREALELAQRCGAERLEERVLEELRVAGARPRRRAASGPGSLTPAERRVALAAADGAGNREIAQALFVSLRTVEMHLTNAYRKLDDCTRSELASKLAAGGED